MKQWYNTVVVLHQHTSWHPAWQFAVVCVVVSCLNPLLSKGGSCFTANNVAINEVLLEELHLSVNSFEETLNSKAYLCHLCDAYAVPLLYYRLLTSLSWF